ncbi:transcription termination factor MTEF1, chloroplastic-like [Phragmites australis]|uniref:transcription termination factor MTEF1, chloroplastic-like n=1 Tax=Phragmites australis TaxID=29695 RepID=UPI002D7823F4|nr:transcription termination factor MTEF1, chloroplastic-like [Phragmites australis]
MFASICLRRFILRLSHIPAAGGTHSFRPNPSDALLSHGYSSTALAGAAGSEPCPATVSYLVSCGLSPAAAATHKHRIRSTAKADAVLALLRRYGFSDADNTEIVRRASLILNLDADRILRPKLDLFASLGVQPRKLATMPLLLTRSLDNHLVPCIQFLRSILGSDRDICHAISRTPRALKADLEKNMRPAVEALRRLGLPEDALSKLLIIEMGVLMISPDRISEIFEDLKALGLGVTDTGFLYGIRAMCCLSRETWLRKVALYQSLGVSEGELRKAFKTQPTIVLFSDESIKKKLRFFMDELKLELSDVMGQPVLIGYSLEKKIIPRCAVLSVLMRERKIEPDIKLRNALIGSTKIFSEKYVLRYAHDVPDVVKAYEGKIKFEGFRDQDVLVPLKP